MFFKQGLTKIKLSIRYYQIVLKESFKIIDYRIRRCPVPPVSLGKSCLLTILLKKFILKIFLLLEITSKKDFLNFSYH